MTLGSAPDVGLAADLMPAAPHDAYGARPESAFLVEATQGRRPEAGCGTPGS